MYVCRRLIDYRYEFTTLIVSAKQVCFVGLSRRAEDVTRDKY